MAREHVSVIARVFYHIHKQSVTISTIDISTDLELSRQSVSTAISCLKKLSLITCNQSGHDKRYYYLTANGKAFASTQSADFNVSSVLAVAVGVTKEARHMSKELMAKHTSSMLHLFRQVTTPREGQYTYNYF